MESSREILLRRTGEFRWNPVAERQQQVREGKKLAGN